METLVGASWLLWWKSDGTSRLENDSGWGRSFPSSGQWRKERFALMSLGAAYELCDEHHLTLTTRRLFIHCRPPHPNQPSARRLPHDALPNDRLPGRAACRPPAACLPVPAPRTRCSSFRLLPVPVRRGQGRQVRQQRLCRPYDDAGPGCKGRHALPAAARPDRGSCQLRFPGTNILSGKNASKSQLTLWN